MSAIFETTVALDQTLAARCRQLLAGPAFATGQAQVFVAAQDQGEALQTLALRRVLVTPARVWHVRPLHQRLLSQLRRFGLPGHQQVLLTAVDALGAHEAPVVVIGHYGAQLVGRIQAGSFMAHTGAR